ncbi:MAG: RNA-binding protein S4 [Rhodospirillaceae bacterium]|nr:RNA-binding protein S4 [Rhodospirillaceae bacterium]
MTEVAERTQRLDKWLWCARFFKSRGRASKLLAGRQLRLSGKVVNKAHQLVRAGDVLTFPQGPFIRVVKVLFLGKRRGPAPEAQLLYEDLEPIGVQHARKPDTSEFNSSAIQRERDGGRPTKGHRRAIDRLMRRQ